MQNELRRFRDACQHIKQDGSVSAGCLAWWSTNHKNYPLLASLARIVLCVPGSQIECERVFSEAGLITAGLRNRLGVENLDMLVFISRNADIRTYIEDAITKVHGAHLYQKLQCNGDIKIKSEGRMLQDELETDWGTSDSNNLVMSAVERMIESFDFEDSGSD